MLARPHPPAPPPSGLRQIPFVLATLSHTHPIGRFEARFFAALGYTAERCQGLDSGDTILNSS